MEYLSKIKEERMRDISKLSAKRQRKIILKLGEEFSKGLRHGINKTLEQVEEKIIYMKMK